MFRERFVGLRMVFNNFIARLKHFWRAFDRHRTVSRYVERIMELSKEDRLNLTKSFDYLGREHYEKHAACLLHGVNYRWVAYDSPTLVADWNKYLAILDKLTFKAQDHPGQLQCRVLPSSESLLPLIPYRITLFGETISVSIEESEPNTYRYSTDSITILGKSGSGANAFDEMKEALETIWNGCDDIRAPRTSRSFASEHERLRNAFLRGIADNLPYELPLKYSQASVYVSFVTWVVAVVTLVIAVIALVVSLKHR
jgi:hypothetical protein